MIYRIIIPFFLLIHSNISAQKKEIISLRKGFVDLTSVKNIKGHLPSSQFQPPAITSLPSLIYPILTDKYYVFKVSFDWLIPMDNYLLGFKKKYNKDIYVLINDLVSYYEFRIDENCNFNFTDESMIKIPKKNTVSYNAQILIDSISKLYFSLPLEIGITNNINNTTTLSLRNLTKYELNYTHGKDTLNLELFAGSYYINFLCNIAKDNPEKVVGRLNEPFYFANKWWKLENLDLLSSKIELTPIVSNKIYGYEKGFYLRFDKLKDLTNANMLYNEKVDWQKDYYLLHFWGDWCKPCVAEIPDMIKLNEKINVSQRAQMIHYPLVARDSLLDKLKKFVLKNNLSKIQSFNTSTYVKKIIETNPQSYINEDYDINALLRSYIFPTYILIDKEGKILYRGELSETLYNKLTELNII